MKTTIKNHFRRVLPLLLCALVPFFSACQDDDEIKVYDVTVQLVYPEGTASYAGAPVELRSSNSSGSYRASTDATGKAVFMIPAGIYEAVTSDVHEDGDFYYICNGTNSQIIVEEGQSASYTIDVKVAKMNGRNPIIIKEIYNGGVMKDDGSANFHFDKCIILYNNSSRPFALENFGIGVAAPYNAEAATVDKIYSDGKLVYENDNFIPAQNGIWYFPEAVTIQPYSQLVVNVHGAIDNTQTVSHSVNYANKDYYCMYDPTYVTSDVTVASAVSYNNTNYYPAPADVIPTSHYLKTVKYGQANAWTFSTTSPATFIFQTQDIMPQSYFEATENYWYVPGYAATPIWRCVKVPNDWIIDGVEMFNAAKKDASKKRLTADIDAGYILLTNQLGHVAYRNVDKTATEALPENTGKLVYNYALGVDSSTDPSGIDAEASMKNGAHIIFMDTNNSTNDFHERQKCSLRGE